MKRERTVETGNADSIELCRIDDPNLLNCERPSEAGRRRILSRRFDPVFLADWNRALFIHFEVDPEALQKRVPFELDLYDGRRAFVSFVAFTMREMRPRLGGPVGRMLLRPIANHPFLNLRVYVRHGGEPGIHFMAEWLPNRLACLLGPPVFGLPYRYGKINYRHEFERGRISGRVNDATGRAIVEYEATVKGEFRPCRRGTADEFLLERYTACNGSVQRKIRRFFRIWHEPWLQLRAEMIFLNHQWLSEFLPGAEFAGANFSPGAGNVWMGRPHFLHELRTENRIP